MLSASSVAGLHHVVAHGLSHFAGWTALRDNAVWWIAIAGLPMAWIGLRAMLDMRECRLAAAFVCMAWLCYGVSAAGYLGLVPSAAEQHASLLTGATMLLGHWLLLAAIVTYARYVILDAQCLITTGRPAAKKQSRKDEKAMVAKTTPEEAKPTVLSVVNYARNKAGQLVAAEDNDRWIDGRRPERKSYDSYDDNEDEDSESGSKLSKADRKRLRKLKSQNRAA
jgi:hypothetical protein